jgi:hypothetical protein
MGSLISNAVGGIALVSFGGLKALGRSWDVRYGPKADILILVLHLGITFWCDKSVLDLPYRVASAFLDRLRTFSPDVSPRRGGL